MKEELQADVDVVKGRALCDACEHRDSWCPKCQIEPEDCRACGSPIPRELCHECEQ